MKHSERNRERTHSLHTTIITRTHLTILYSVSHTASDTYTVQMSVRSWQVSAINEVVAKYAAKHRKCGSYSSTTPQMRFLLVDNGRRIQGL